MTEPFGSFGWICRQVPLPQCNIIFARLWRDEHYDLLYPVFGFTPHNLITIASPRSAAEMEKAEQLREIAGTGVGAFCDIPRLGTGGPGDIALMVASVLSVVAIAALIYRASKRTAAVGKFQVTLFHLIFITYSTFQAITVSSIVKQGSRPAIVFSAVQSALASSLCWCLLDIALAMAQVILCRFLPWFIRAVPAPLLFCVTMYCSLDACYGWSRSPNMIESDYLTSYPMFIFTFIWPALALTIFTAGMLWAILKTNARPALPAATLLMAVVIFASGQGVLFGSSQRLCMASHGKINASFIAVICNTISIGLLHLLWTLITDEDYHNVSLFLPVPVTHKPVVGQNPAGGQSPPGGQSPAGGQIPAADQSLPVGQSPPVGHSPSASQNITVSQSTID